MRRSITFCFRAERTFRILGSEAVFRKGKSSSYLPIRDDGPYGGDRPLCGGEFCSTDPGWPTQCRNCGGEFVMLLAAASRCFFVNTNSCNFCFTSEEAIAPEILNKNCLWSDVDTKIHWH